MSILTRIFWPNQETIADLKGYIRILEKGKEEQKAELKELREGLESALKLNQRQEEKVAHLQHESQQLEKPLG